MNTIQVLYTLVPAALCVLMLVMLHFYDVEKQLKGLRAEKDTMQNVTEQ